MKTTKELARELGLLRKRTLSSTGTRTSCNGSKGQVFKYLIVIDFESTCWQDAKFKTQEIIEFPAVLLNTITGEIESEFHHYVQPQEQPILSSFCTELTGIKQCQVDEGIPINICLRKFTHWLDKLYRENNVVCHGSTNDVSKPINTTCVTWSDWDLGVCLQYECKRKQLMKPVQLSSWIDLRATYRKFYDRKPNGLNGALQDLGIEFQGREHSGVDDARNTAKLAFRMIKDGCHMQNTKTVKNHERSVSCNPSIPHGVMKATRITPPRKAKLTNHTTPVSSVSDSPRTSSKLPKSSSLSPNFECETTSNTATLNGLSKNTTPKKTSIPSKIPVNVNSPLLDNNREKRINKVILHTDNSPSVAMESNKCSPPQKSSISLKRKQFTPVKNAGGNQTNSPLRKKTRQNTPKKFSASDIYVDPVSDHVKCNETVTKNGLKVQDTNVMKKNCGISDKQVAESYMSKENQSGCFKKPSPIVNNSSTPCFKVPVTPSMTNKSSTPCFKVPVTPSVTNKSSTSCFKVHVTPSITNKSSTPCIKVPVTPSITNKSSTPCLKVSVTPFITNKSSTPCIKVPVTPSITPKGGICPGSINKGSMVTSTPISGVTSVKNYPYITNISSGVKPLSSPNLSVINPNGFKTPCNSTYNRSSNNSNICSNDVNTSSMKVTPPLCKCGRRSRRRMVQSPGQNMGRFFFSCSVRKRVGAKEGCDFFKWETNNMGQLSVSNNSSVISKHFTPVMSGGASVTVSGQKRSLGVRYVPGQKSYIR